ncbi:predicted protein [Histoplasma mississippiense (nom. inval.)]|uniref:predicted protein n=1 Tax=Ajellomyces capsulatus (strain NAm1 / WU24) TaxID=2059318 RepID=UPI000157C5E8|nr:predicted protein [Histoplasma mississippiense (nom. inval.)]EDN08302.1 predicted protein [Histoplasma mississippiense (nom. inval.)]
MYVCISLPKGMETCYAGEISMYTERENRIQVATLEKTQLIAKDFSELRIHFWPDCEFEVDKILFLKYSILFELY